MNQPQTAIALFEGKKIVSKTNYLNNRLITHKK
jgi:hypothetical protein